jgi:hypothetical protein
MPRKRRQILPADEFVHYWSTSSGIDSQREQTRDLRRLSLLGLGVAGFVFWLVALSQRLDTMRRQIPALYPGRVMRGIDPRIHQKRILPQIDGLPRKPAMTAG